MSRRRGWIFFVLGLVLALGTGVMVFFFLQRQAAFTAEQSRAEALRQYAPPPTMSLPVAARPLDPGTTMSSADVVMKDFPLDLVPLAAITETTGLNEKVLLQPIGQGETFHSRQFVGGQGSGISQQIKPGNVLFAFPIDDLMSQSDIIRDGDHIDLYITSNLQEVQIDAGGQVQPGTEQDRGKVTLITMQYIEVFKVLRPAKTAEDQQEGAPTALLLSVTPADAAIIKYAKDAGGTIDFTLRSPADKEPFTVPSIDREEFARLYLKLQ